MTIDDQIREEKLQHDINTEATKELVSMNILQVKKCCLLIKNK